MDLLPPKETENIIDMAKRQKLELGIGSSIPVISDIFYFLEKKDIALVQYPIESEGPNELASIFVSIKEDDCEFKFIGLNTNDYYDKQIFAIAHELYHYATYSGNTEPHISRHTDTEKKADFFAAEFLLPQEALKSEIVNNFGKLDISGISTSAVLRFIARMHCTWGLPYKSIVKRLYEIGAADSKRYEELYAVDERDTEGDYYKIGMSTDEDAFLKLNKITRKTGTDMRNLEVMAKNYEDGIIGENTLMKGLELFSRTLEDFGLHNQIEGQ